MEDVDEIRQVFSNTVPLPSFMLSNLVAKIGVLLDVDATQGKHRAWNHRHIGPLHQLEHAQSVVHFLVAPGVAGHHGDAQQTS
jgi:hypothetical protein